MNNLLAYLVAAWFAQAVLIGWIMGRRGFEAYAWTVVAVALGPLALPVALWNAIRPRAEGPRLLRPGGRGLGAVDVLIGCDGSETARAAASSVVKLLDARIRRLTVAGVIPFDAIDETELRVKRQLDIERERLSPPAATVILRGHPVTALRDYASRLGYDLLVVGPRGDGRSALLMGSVASELASHSPVPVLIAGSSGANEAHVTAGEGAAQHEVLSPHS